jgi:hypothetical protein
MKCTFAEAIAALQVWAEGFAEAMSWYIDMGKGDEESGFPAMTLFRENYFAWRVPLFAWKAPTQEDGSATADYVCMTMLQLQWHALLSTAEVSEEEVGRFVKDEMVQYVAPY